MQGSDTRGLFQPVERFNPTEDFVGGFDVKESFGLSNIDLNIAFAM
jgi:hypothetical protein